MDNEAMLSLSAWINERGVCREYMGQRKTKRGRYAVSVNPKIVQGSRMMVKQGRYMPGVRVNKIDLARIFGVEHRIIDIWLCKGLPYICKPNPKIREAPDERDWLFDTAEAIEWRVTTPSIEDDW